MLLEAGLRGLTLAWGTFALLEIWFENTQDERRYNHNVIIHAKDTYNDAMRAEHSKRSYVL